MTSSLLTSLAPLVATQIRGGEPCERRVEMKAGIYWAGLNLHRTPSGLQVDEENHGQ